MTPDQDWLANSACVPAQEHRARVRADAAKPCTGKTGRALKKRHREYATGCDSCEARVLIAEGKA